MNILGYPLDRAAAILERAGYRVETVEARSRKGVEGDSKPVSYTHLTLPTIA